MALHLVSYLESLCLCRSLDFDCLPKTVLKAWSPGWGDWEVADPLVVSSQAIGGMCLKGS